MYFNTVCLSINLALWSFYHFSRFYDKLFFLSCLLHVPLIIFAVRTTIFCSVEKRHTVACLTAPTCVYIYGKIYVHGWAKWLLLHKKCCWYRILCPSSDWDIFFTFVAARHRYTYIHTYTNLSWQKVPTNNEWTTREYEREKNSFFGASSLASFLCISLCAWRWYRCWLQTDETCVWIALSYRAFMRPVR